MFRRREKPSGIDGWAGHFSKAEVAHPPSCFCSAFKRTGAIPLREMLATRRFAVYRDQGSEIALAAFGADSAIEFLSAATITR
jgi:hypothetical protein